MNYFLLFLTLLLPSCSVIMASKRDGVSLESIERLCNRAQCLTHASEILSSEVNEDGDLVEIYKIQMERGSTARALIHGLLDVGSLCAWELIATPIESALDEKKFYSLQVTFDEDEQIKQIKHF